VPFPNTADQSFRRQPESVSRFASQTKSGTTPNPRKQLDTVEPHAHPVHPQTILPAGSGRPEWRCDGVDIERFSVLLAR